MHAYTVGHDTILHCFVGCHIEVHDWLLLFAQLRVSSLSTSIMLREEYKVL